MCISELLDSTASKYITLFIHYIYSGKNRQLAPLFLDECTGSL